MSKITGNEPAMPVTANNTVYTTGLTIRQQFAMAAMQGILSNPETLGHLDSAQTMAQWAISNADALINELNRTEAPNV